MKQMIATKRSFVHGTLVEQGFPVNVPDDMKTGDNLVDGGDYQPSIVQNSAIAPTGPNPTAPQQIGPDTIQTTSGYAKPGAQVVGEVTRKQEERIDKAGLADKQGGEQKLSELMEGAGDGQNDDDALVEGTVAEITADLGGKTDEELTALRAAEVDREKPRKGVLSAIDAELEGRKGE